jgi:hypothetical protein
MRNLARMEYITIISIMVTMTVWDFVIGVLFGIVVSCESKPLPFTARNSPVHGMFQVSFLSFKTPSGAAFAHATRETPRFPPSAVQQITAHTSTKCPNRHASSNSKGSSSLARSLTSKTPSVRSSTTRRFMLTRSALSSSIFRMLLGSTCQLRKRL